VKKILFFALIAINAQSAMANTYVKNLWNQNELVACFGKSAEERVNMGQYKFIIKDWKEKDKEDMKRWINEEFTAERTGIHFTGWLDCEESPNADIIIFYNKNSKIKSALFGGLQGIASNIGPATNIVPGYPLARSSVTMSKSGLNKGTAVHEFGHVAGLAHEHIHPDANVRTGCRDTKPMTMPGYVYEPFDAKSIMSYCSINLNRLSDKDVDLLRRLYP
jgi:hypothetical protein